MFADTKATMIEANKLGNNRVNRLLSQSLFLISTAGNDFLAFGDGRATRSDASAYIAKMVTTYLKHIKELYRLGARRLGLLDALPIGCLPGCRTSFGHDGACDAVANSLARRFNALLRLEMASATAASMPCMEYSIASIYGIFSDMITNLELDNGLQEATSACCGGGRLNAEIDCSASSNLCTDRDGYVFWDKVHGTQAAYQRAVAAMFDGAGVTKFTEPVSFGQLITGKQPAPVAVLDKPERPYVGLEAEI